MGLLDRLTARDAFPELEAKASSTDREGWFYDWATQDAGDDGPVRGVSPEKARGLPAVWACVGILAEDMAKLPVGVYQRRGKTRTELREHPVSLLLDEPNATQTGFELVEFLVGSTALRGNGYWQIEIDRRGAPVGLYCLDPRNVTVMCTPDRRELFYRLSDGTVLPSEQVLHLRWRSADGLVGMSPVREMRESLSLALGAQQFANSAFYNSAAPKGVLQSDQLPSPEAMALVRSEFEKVHRGPKNAGRVAVLPMGLKWQAIGLSMEDLQFVEQRGLSVTEAARIWRIPPHKIGDLSKATFSNIEQQAIEYVTDTLLPWVRRIEQRLAVSLLSRAERAAGIYIKIDLAGILRGDAKSRAEALAIQRQNGVINANDWRALEDLDPISPEDGGDDYWRPGNMMKTTDEPPPKSGAPAAPAPPPTGGQDDA